MRKILLIAYHFHPDASVGAQRTIKFAKYLPEFGWEPHILTVHPRYYRVVDETPLTFDCTVHRTNKWLRPDDLYTKIRSLLSATTSSTSDGIKDTGSDDVKSPQENARIPWWKRFFNTLSVTPDSNCGWFFPAVWRAVRLIKRHQYDLIYTSGPPQTTHLIGLAASKLTGARLVLDFRDPWYDPGRNDPFVLQWSRNFDPRNEKRAVEQAALVLTTTDEWRDHLKKLYYPALDDKCFTLINGYDDADFEDFRHEGSSPPSRPFTFLHAGTLYHGREPYALLTAAGELYREGALEPDEIKLKFIGINEVNWTRVKQVISKFALGDVVEFGTPVPRSAYMALLKNSAVLVLFQGSAATVHIPAKAFDYLATGKHILVLAGRGATRDFMTQFDQVSIAGIDNKDEIRTAIKHLMGRLRGGATVSTDDPRMKTITKRNLTARLASLLDNVVGSDDSLRIRSDRPAASK
jgi:glycosyltransferase involved in cell wall biosynthesis